MKYILSFCGFIIFAITAATAQVAIKPAVGLNFTDFTKDPATGKYKAKAGYQFGGSVAFGKKVYLEPGFYWVKKSTEYITEDTNEKDINFDLSGIRIPVSVGFNLLGSEKSIIGLRVYGGASAFLLTTVKELNKDDFKTASWGAFAGAGLDIALVFVEIKQEWSLTNVQKNISRIDVGKSRSLFLQAGVRIPL